MWHNPACSKCATAHETLNAAGIAVDLRPYLQEPPTAEALRDVLRRLGARPWDVCRLGEPVATSLGLADWGRTADDEDRWIEVMVAHPVLIQRPILVLDDGSAVVGRSPEALAEVVRRSGGDAAR